MNKNLELLDKIYGELSEELKDTIESTEFEGALITLSKKYDLHVDQSDALFNEIMLFIMGLIHPENFVSGVRTALNIDQKMAEQISFDVNQIFFLPLRELLKYREVGEHEIEKPENNGKEEEPLPVDRDALLKEIEMHTNSLNEAPASVTPAVAVNAPETQPRLESTTTTSESPVTPVVTDSNQKQESIPVIKKGYGSEDPYREAI